MNNRKAFTLLEVLISIGLMGIVLVALFSTVDTMQDSNRHLLKHLEKSKKISKATKVLFLDIMASDANLTLKKDEFSRLCIEETTHSLYALSIAKVCWLVLKKDKALIRVEGNNYNLPTKDEEKVEIDIIMKDIEIFDIYHEKDKVLVLIKQHKKEPISFMLQGILKAKAKKVKNVKKPIKPKKPTASNIIKP